MADDQPDSKPAEAPDVDSEEQVPDEQVAEEQVDEEQVAEEQVDDERVAEQQVAEEQVAKEQVAEEQVAEEHVAETQVAEETDEEAAARREVERAAVRQIREERKLLTPSKYGDYFVLKIVLSLVVGVIAILAAGYWYGQHKDPCFEFKLETSLFLDDPFAWYVWQMECRRDKGYCECIMIPERGRRLQCAAIEGKNEVFCVMLSPKPTWF